MSALRGKVNPDKIAKALEKAIKSENPWWDEICEENMEQAKYLEGKGFKKLKPVSHSFSIK